MRWYVKRFSIFIFLFMVITFKSYAVDKVILKGIIQDPKNDYEYFNFHEGDKSLTHFPLKYYTFTLLAYHLTYAGPVHFKNKNIKNLNNFAAEIDARLDLVSVDKTKKIYRFKLSFKSVVLKYIGTKDLTMRYIVGGVPVNGTVTFPHQSPNMFNVEVILSKNKHNRPFLINISNNDVFKIDFFADKAIALIRLSDLPINLLYFNN